MENVEHLIIPASQCERFTGNLISLGFEVVVRQKKQCEDVTLDIFLYFYILMFFPPNQLTNNPNNSHYINR